jgi:F-type H+-transporting ATPase subunit alpha
MRKTWLKTKFNWGIYGVVLKISDSIITVIGLNKIGYGETIFISTKIGKVKALVLNIARNVFNAAVFNNDIYIKPGQGVFAEGSLVSIPTSDELLGRIIDPLGLPLDGLKLNRIEKKNVQ